MEQETSPGSEAKATADLQNAFPQHHNIQNHQSPMPEKHSAQVSTPPSFSHLQTINNLPPILQTPNPHMGQASIQTINQLSEKMIAHAYSNMKRPAPMQQLIQKGSGSGSRIHAHTDNIAHVEQMLKVQTPGSQNKLPSKKRSAEDFMKHDITHSTNGSSMPSERIRLHNNGRKVVKRVEWLHNHSRLCGFHYPRAMTANKEAGETRKQGKCVVCQKRGVGIRCMVCHVFLHCEGREHRNCYWKFHNLKDYASACAINENS